MDNIEFNLNEVFREIISRMETEGAFDKDAYFNLIDEALEDKIGNGELGEDANIKSYVEALQMMWPQAEALITKSEEGQSVVADENETKASGDDQ